MREERERSATSRQQSPEAGVQSRKAVAREKSLRRGAVREAAQPRCGE